LLAVCGVVTQAGKAVCQRRGPHSGDRRPWLYP
jgi:hypothetical protein